MAKNNEFLEVEGTVEELLPSTTFRVRMDDGRLIFAYLSGRLRINQIRILPGDHVKIQMSPYDLSKGRIVFRS